MATTVTLTGAVGNLCVLTVSTPGALGLAGSGTTMSSDDTGGLPAVLSVTATGTNPSVFFAAPVLSGPAATVGSATREMAYTSTGGANQGYTAAASNYAMTRLVDVFTIKARAMNAAGFVTGTYSVATTATCQQ